MALSPTTPPSSGGSETLTRADEELLQAARQVLPHAHCPYSGFRVGAAVRSSGGDVFAAVNVESVSFGLTLCAERAALAAAVAAGVKELVAVAIVTEGPSPATPCGACRQFLSEFGPQMRVVSVGSGSAAWISSMDELLPHPFSARLANKDETPES